MDDRETRQDKMLADRQAAPGPAPAPSNGISEERLVMGEFEGAILYYVPTRHAYRVELGALHEEFHATWEPVFGMDVADLQMAEAVLDRLLAVATSGS